MENRKNTSDDVLVVDTRDGDIKIGADVPVEHRHDLSGLLPTHKMVPILARIVE